MTISFNEVREKTVKEQLETKIEQYKKLNHQLINTIQADQIVTLEKAIGDLESDILKLTELQNRLAEESSNQNWETNLPKINYKEAFSIVDDIFTRIKDGGAALFLLQDSRNMGGEWCAARIMELLNQDSSKTKPYQVEFLPHQKLDEKELMLRLGNYLNITVAIENPEEYANTIISSICDSLQIGSTVFVKLTIWDNLSWNENFLRWLIEKFWQPLVRKINESLQEFPLFKCVFLVISNNKLVPACLHPWLICSRERFDQEKILELPLGKWTEEEIKNWLYRFSNRGLSLHEYAQMASSIYQSSSEGLPVAVYSSLIEHYKPVRVGPL
jgi:hypothetical protein